MGHRFSKTAANAAYTTTTPVNQVAHQTFCCSISKRPIANTLAAAATSANCMANHSIEEEMSLPSTQHMHILPEAHLHLSAQRNGECSLATTAIDTSATATVIAATSSCNNFNPCERSISSNTTNCNFNLNSNTNLFEQSLANTCYTQTSTATGILQHSGHNDHSHSLSSINNLSCGRQIIIKIQLAKMENGNAQTSTMQRQYQQLQASPTLALPLSPLPSSTHLIESPTTDGNQNIVDDILPINKAISTITNTSTTVTTTAADHSAEVPLTTLMTEVLTRDDQHLNLSLNIDNQLPLPLSSSLSTLWPSSHSSTLLAGTAGSSSEYPSMPKDNFNNKAIANAPKASNDTSISHHAASTIVPTIHTTTCDLRNATPLFNAAITSSDNCGENRSRTKVGSSAASLTTDAENGDRDCSGHHYRHRLISGFVQFDENDLKMQNADEAVDYYEVLEGSDVAIATTATASAEEQEVEEAVCSSSTLLTPTQMNNYNNNNINGAAAELYAESKTACFHGKFLKLPAQSNVVAPILSPSSDDRFPTTSSCSVGSVTKWRYRDIFRRLLEPVSLRACNKGKCHRDGRKPSMEQSFGRKCKNQHAKSGADKEISLGAEAVATVQAGSATTSLLANDSLHSNTSVGENVSQQEVVMTTATPMSLVSASSARSEIEIVEATLMPTDVATTTAMATVSKPNSHLSIWASNQSNSGDVIIPIATQPQFVVLQCSILNAALGENVNSSTNTSGFSSAVVNDPFTATVDNSNGVNMNRNENNHISLPNEAKETVNISRAYIPSGPVVHSQIDFCHHLVPDLERIIQSSFYWGKMDRYEAERLLEGNPEGTFLLRDSAQEEFLFSVTFRKYGRSLHARIEQSGHRFSFDCHDPCVFTASTVTGLLEHYKDPACVMFFEPMLTIPLHRKTCFSLQQLCRATIVSHITYDGINKLELPSRLKFFLKEYHYKQKLREKPFDEPYYI